jgi:hypothetical protein
VALIPRAAAGLQRRMDPTDLSKTGIVNRAIKVYEFMDCLGGRPAASSPSRLPWTSGVKVRGGHSRMTVCVSPVLLSLMSNCRPARISESMNSYRVMARFTTSVLDSLVLS